MTGPLQTLLPACLLAMSILMPTLTTASRYTSPEQIEGVNTVDAEALIELATRSPKLVIIDSRLRPDRKDGYIEGSISLPDSETDCTTLAASVPTLDTPVLFYCNGIRCARSGHAARIALGCGYRRIYWFRTGIEEWRKKEYPLVR